MEKEIFEKLIDFEVPIIFIINKTSPSPKNEKKKEKYEDKKNDIKNTIHNFIENAFKKKGEEEKSKKFIANFTEIFFINLIDDPTSDDKPAFGIDKVLSYFKTLVKEEDWEKLEKSCYNKNEEKYKKYSKENIFLKSYCEFEIIKKKIKIKH